MEVFMSKILGLLLLFVVTVVFGLLPLSIAKWLESGSSKSGQFDLNSVATRLKSTVNYLLSFGGGVLMATCFLHMLPEVREQLMGGLETDGRPMGELLVCAGFFAVYLLEEVVDFMVENCCQSGQELKGLLEQSGSTSDTDVWVFGGQKDKSKTEEKWYQSEVNSDTASHHHHHHSDYTVNHEHYNPFAASASRKPTTDAESGLLQCPDRASLFPTSNYGAIAPTDQETCHKQNVTKSQVTKCAIRGLIVVIALSFHSVIEGTAVGLQSSSRNVWTLLTAIALHKVVTAFSIGMQLTCSNIGSGLVAAYMTTLSAMSPLGVLLGALVSTSSLQEGQFVGVCQAVAAGTLLYVTFFDVLMTAKQTEGCSGLLRFASTLVGFVAMASITLLNEHSHESGATMTPSIGVTNAM